MTDKKNLTIKDIYEQQSEALYNLVMSSDQRWRKQWASEEFTQRNETTNTPYSNINQTLLFDRAVQENNQDPRWLTFNQIKEKGYKLKKGSKGSKIYRVVKQYDRILKDDDGNAILDNNGKEQTETVQYLLPLIKVHTVFNARDIEGIEPFKLAEIPEQHKLLLQQEKYRNAEAMINNFCKENGIKLKEIASQDAFYQGNNGYGEKQVVVPLKSQFEDLNDYFSVLFHEVGHSTKTLGIRINTETDTPTGNKFGSKNYAKEELTAELTALFLCKQFGINSTATAEQEKNSFAYLQSWVNTGVLSRDDFHIAVIEANRATKAIFSHAPEISLSIDNLDNSKADISISESISSLVDTISEIESSVTKIDIDLARDILTSNNNLDKEQREAIEKIIGKSEYEEVINRAIDYLNNWEEIKDIMNNNDYSKDENIHKILTLAINSENPTELKAVIMGILEDKEKEGKITIEEFNSIADRYIDTLRKIENGILQNESHLNNVNLSQEEILRSKIKAEFKDFTINDMGYIENLHITDMALLVTKSDDMDLSLKFISEELDRYKDNDLKSDFMNELEYKISAHKKEFSDKIKNIGNNIDTLLEHKNGKEFTSIDSIYSQEERNIFTKKGFFEVVSVDNNVFTYKLSKKAINLINSELSKSQNNNLLQNYNNTKLITTENIKEYITGYNENQIDTLRHPDFKGIKILYSQATKDYFASQDPNAYKGNPYVEAQRQAKTPIELLNSSVNKLNIVAEKLAHHNIKLIPFSESSKIPKDDFSEQVDKMLKEKDTTILLHLNNIRKGKSFDDMYSVFSITEDERKSTTIPTYQRYVDLGYMENLGSRAGLVNVHYYKLTEKGLDIINDKFEYALQIEKQKIGKLVTLKEYQDFSKNLNDNHNNLISGTAGEFTNRNYPEKMLPILDQGKEMLIRPFNASSFPYKKELEMDIERIEKTMNLWDKAQLNKLKTTDGEEITSIKFLWGETKTSEQNRVFGTDLDKLQNWFKQNYSEQQITNSQGYFKNNFEITYTNNNGENISFEKRIDIGKNPNDFNPYRENIKTYLEKSLDRQFIKQEPNLSKNIHQELKNKKSKIKQQGIKI